MGSSRKPRILVVGSANMDMVLPMPRMPHEGESVICINYTYIPGGKGANAAVAASRAGADVVFCTKVGNDENGRRLLQAYKDENIDTRYIKFDKSAPTGLAAVMLNEVTKKNRIAVYPGANTQLKTDDVEDAFLSYPDALLLQFETNAASISSAVDFAYEQQIPVFIDAGPIRNDFPNDMYSKLKNIEVVSPNEIEMAQLTGINPTSSEMCLQACMKLMSIIPTKYVVIKLSNRGCFVYDGKYCEFILAHNVYAVDTTAAGDAFTAALTVEYLRTGDISRACKYANVAGALTVTKLGAINSLPTGRQIDDFIATKKVKL